MPKVHKTVNVKLKVMLVMTALLVALIPQVVLAGPTISDDPGDPSGNGIQLAVWQGGVNPDCSDVCTVCGGSTKFDSLDKVGDGTYSKDGVTITIDGDSFDWTSTFPISAVMVKGGPNENIYTYAPGEAMGDSDLHAPINPNSGQLYGLSHIEFCYEIPTPPVPEVSTIILVSLGLLALGGFIWFKRRQVRSAI